MTSLGHWRKYLLAKIKNLFRKTVVCEHKRIVVARTSSEIKTTCIDCNDRDETYSRKDDSWIPA